MGLTNQLQSIPTIFKGILTGFLTILMIRITYPITNYILGLYTDGTIMKYVAVLIFWLIILFVTWFLLWIVIFKPKEAEQNG